MKKINLILYFSVIALFCSCENKNEKRLRINLAGEWEFYDARSNNDILPDIPPLEFEDKVVLPGTTDTNKKGTLTQDRSETSHLTRIYNYEGKAWYKKQIAIPPTWQDKDIILILERTKPSQVWINDIYVGRNDNISTSQVYDLTHSLVPGIHNITILVDNGNSVPEQIISNSHAYTNSTQNNWNGIIGDIFIEARNKLHIEEINVTPDISKKSVSVKVKISNPELIEEGMPLALSAVSWNGLKRHVADKAEYILKKDQSDYVFEYPLGDNAILWSEFNPTLYSLEVKLPDHDKKKVNFGLREFKTKGTQFTINDNITFLRGKHDACVFPLTAHTPMDVDSWKKYFRICKEYGINHVRFHSWCPPAACFEAADIMGIYLQGELPFWGGLKREENYLTDFLLKEGVNIQKEYGNHASFVLFALGNELSGDLDLMEEITDNLRRIDNRRLYAFGSNNFLGYHGQVEGEDFLVTCRIGGADDYSTHTRGSFSFADADQGGYLNNTYPNSTQDFSKAISECTVPVISHETGQFQVYPNYDEMSKYQGVLSPVNIGIFRNRLVEAGMIDQAEEFFRASGRWSALLYKAEIEMDLRTKGFGGFQLLDLQDYPGQGSAYVGILDAFMDSKGHISSEEWRGFCNDLVPLFITEKFCWKNNEILTGKVKIANYSNKDILNKKVNWSLKTLSGTQLDRGDFLINSNENGLISLGRIKINTSSLTEARELQLELGIEGSIYTNQYTLWIYPDNEKKQPEDNTLISSTLDEETLTALKNGKNVLLFPEKDKCANQTVGALFQTDYWNYRMFKGICEWAKKPVSPGTLGLLIDTWHPLFDDFPTDYHTNWQWYPMVKQSYPLIMDKMPEGYKPIVQVIDNVERNHRLGMIFEFKVGEGNILVCMSDLESVIDKPEAKQLYNSLVEYAGSEYFSPDCNISEESLLELFTGDACVNDIKGVRNISYED